VVAVLDAIGAQLVDEVCPRVELLERDDLTRAVHRRRVWRRAAGARTSTTDRSAPARHSRRRRGDRVERRRVAAGDPLDDPIHSSSNASARTRPTRSQSNETIAARPRTRDPPVSSKPMKPALATPSIATTDASASSRVAKLSTTTLSR
jgi:hypothetical protein